MTLSPLLWTGIACAAALAGVDLWAWRRPRFRAIGEDSTMTSYHFHDKGPGPWLMRVTSFDFRYTVCEGTAEGCAASAASNCHVIGVAATRYGVRRVVRKREREHRAGRGKRFYEYPPTEVAPR